MTISDAKIQVSLPVGAKNITKSDGTLPTVRYVPVGPNLLSNGDFETDTSGWTPGGSAVVTRDTGTKKVGSASMKIVVSDGASNAIATSINVQPGAVYYLGQWVYGNVNGSRILIDWYDANGVSISTTDPGTITVAAWKFLSVNVAAPPNAATARLRALPSLGAAGTAYFDAVVFQPCVPVAESPFTEPAAGAFAGGSVAWSPSAGAHFLGDVKVFDMGAQTSIALADSSYTRVYARRHAFAGDMLVDTGILRVRFKPQGGNACQVDFSVLVHGSWQATRPLLVDTGGGTTANLATATLGRFTRGLVTVNTLDQDGNVATFTFRRGRSDVQLSTTRSTAVNARQDVSAGSGVHRFQVYNARTVLNDLSVTPGGSNVAGAGLTEPYALSFDPAVPYLLAVGMTRKPTTLYGHAPNDIVWEDTAATTSAFKRTFWLIVMPWPWLISGATFNEAESGTLAGGATSVADANASGGNAASLAAQNAQSTVTFVAGRDLPLGDYSLVVRALDSAQVATDLDLRVRDTTTATTLAQTQVAALTAAYAYYALDFSLATADNGNTIELRVLKSTATANTIKADYFLIVPRARNSSTPQHVQFPRDAAHNALMTVTQRDSIRRA